MTKKNPDEEAVKKTDAFCATATPKSNKQRFKYSKKAAKKQTRRLLLSLRQEKKDFLATAIPVERFPVFSILSSDFDAAALPSEFGFTSQQLENLRATIPSVGRIESRLSNTFFFGTGFAVGPNLILTNRHVTAEFVTGQGRGDALKLRLKSCVINFGREEGVGSVNVRCKIVSPVLVHPYWDIALLETEVLPSGVQPLQLAATTDSAIADRVIAVIGYPANSDGNRMTTAVAAVADEIFGGINGLKRLQPGRLRGPVQVTSDTIPSLDHSASTLPGNSGSPVIDVETGLVVGIHYGGQDSASNWSVPACDVCRDRRVAGIAGINFASGGVVDASGAWETNWTALGDVF